MSEGPGGDGGSNVAIACQGGGSHTAFTAGALTELLAAFEGSDDDLVGLSGTSGGAIAAAAGWYGSLAADSDPRDLLAALWDDIAATDAFDRWANGALVWGSGIEQTGVPMPDVTPYQLPFDNWARAQLRDTLERHLDFDRFDALATEESPELVVGAVDITEGCFATFADGDVTAEAILASAAVPDLFEGVEIDGDVYWDGLFSQNPPIRDLFHVPVERKPDELWVLQINPQTIDDEPRSLRGILDRRNELAGNLSLNQELHFVERINDLVAEVRRLGFDRDLGYASKLDRSPAFIDDLFADGRERAAAFLDERQ
jgi:NTE family protein